MAPYPLEPLFGRILTPFEQFLQRATAGGIVLMAATVLTLLLSNSPWSAAFARFWEIHLHLGLGRWQMDHTLHHWVNDGLMALFFFLVGLELKRELLAGELASPRDAALPVIAALGGMLAPAALFHLFNPAGPAAAGWGIPMATDIAFAIGILVLLAWRIPRNLILFLTALAIADDLGAVLVIAIFYTQSLHPGAMLIAAGLFALLILLNQGGVRHSLPYLLLGLPLWYFVMASGIHATVAGILLAFTIPARPAVSTAQFDARLSELQQHFHARAVLPDAVDNSLGDPKMAAVASNLSAAANTVLAPQQRMEQALSPWVTFAILPIFAMANAGINFSTVSLGMLFSPVALGTCAGLVLGKFLGISVASWLAVRLRLARLPHGVGWRHILGAAWLGGIGFTMSLFISQLAFSSATLQEAAKLGILIASLIAGIVGLTWLYLAGSQRSPA
ncbi:Na+/H+ antiporter NhaA [Acidithiobacillus sulfuriphilus]|uniref:Na+/H+ antiporter NhaA n=1 Tax=Acidithiobacillus sulfuriphilus TaxID=1867749 RepID=A0ACD5HQV7_9PROT|nr:Na+/H+ antiporter NhaA [Acidithiobacillus sulfuriphilus]